MFDIHVRMRAIQSNINWPPSSPPIDSFCVGVEMPSTAYHPIAIYQYRMPIAISTDDISYLANTHPIMTLWKEPVAIFILRSPYQDKTETNSVQIIIHKHIAGDDYLSVPSKTKHFPLCKYCQSSHIFLVKNNFKVHFNLSSD